MDKKYESKIAEIVDVAKQLRARQSIPEIDVDELWRITSLEERLPFLNIATTIVMGYDIEQAMGVIADRMPHC